MQADVSESKIFLRIYQLHIGSIHMLVGSNSVCFFLTALTLVCCILFKMSLTPFI